MPRTGWDREELRRRALAAAAEHIRRQGAARFNLSDVAKALGLSHAALYKVFPDKDAFRDAVAEAWLRHVDEELDALARGNGSPRRRLEAWFIALHRMKRQKVAEDPEVYAAFDLAAEKRRPFVKAHVDGSLAVLQGLFRELAKAEGLKGLDAAREARLLFEGTLAFHHPKLIQARLDEDRVPDLTAVLRRLLPVAHRIQSARPKKA